MLHVTTENNKYSVSNIELTTIGCHKNIFRLDFQIKSGREFIDTASIELQSKYYFVDTNKKYSQKEIINMFNDTLTNFVKENFN